MRNWFILFTTTFTMTTIVIAIISWATPMLGTFNNKYVLMLGISSAILSLCVLLLDKIAMDNIFIMTVVDITVIFSVVFLSGLLIKVYPLSWQYFFIVLLLVVVIYAFIICIYQSILVKESEAMNKQIKDWRWKNVDSNRFK